jgi:hypothetical protein
MEERDPSLQYALVTASDPLVTGNMGILQAAIDRSHVDRKTRSALIRPMVRAGVALAMMRGVYAAANAVERRLPVMRDAAAAAEGVPVIPNRLLNLTVSVQPPAYAGGAVQEISDPSAVTALVGSSITVRGAGRPHGVTARLGDHSVPVGGHGSWQIRFIMPALASTVTFVDRDFDRVIAVIPIADQPPSVSLTQPSRDTVWRRVPDGGISFAARAADDVGLSGGHFEYTVTTGSGEIFKSRTSSFAASRFGNARAAEMRATLALGGLALSEGAILSVRAVVADNNTRTGPAITSSDTRTFRVARADESDSLAVDAAAPPPVDRSLLTERMLIASAESLLTKRSSLARSDYGKSAGRIALDQGDLRKRVYSILYAQDEAGAVNGVEGDDEELDPRLVLNRDLKQAYDAMWDAERSLNIAEIDAALPFMTRALHALDRARLANRLYLRGRSQRVVVDIEKVRLTGRDKGLSNVIIAERPRGDTAEARLSESLNAALAIRQSDPRQFVDALIRLRAEAAPVNAAFGAALGEAVDVLRAGRDATTALVRARRALLGAPRPGNAAVPWTGSWSGTR